MTADVVRMAEFRAMKAERCKVAPSIPPRGVRPKERREAERGMRSPGEQRLADNRAEPRHVMEGRCVPTLRLNGHDAAIKNISRSGLMAAAPMNATPGSRLRATIAGSHPLSARVIWKRDGLIGLEVPLGSMELAPL